MFVSVCVYVYVYTYIYINMYMKVIRKINFEIWIQLSGRGLIRTHEALGLIFNTTTMKQENNELILNYAEFT